MRYKTIFLAAALTIAAACSKATDPATPDLYPVRFNITGLAVEYGEMTKAGGTPATFIKTIIENGGAKYSESTLTISSASDLTPEIYVPSGDSKIYFVAGGSGCSADDLSLTYGWDGVKITANYKEVFSASVDVNPESATTYTASLQRVTGGLQFVILDADKAPTGSEIENALFSFSKRPEYYNINTASSGIGTTGPLSTPQTAIASCAHIFPFSAQEITIDLYDAGGNIYNTYKVTAAVFSNRITKIKGNIYGATPQFTVSFSESWGTDNDVAL